MSNIKTLLQKDKKEEKKHFDESDAVKAVLLLENSEAAEDLRIATALGGNHSISRALNDKGKMISMEKLDGKYAGNVYTIEQVKDLAKRYNLRFLQSKYYCGNLDVEVIAKLKAFAKETNTEITTGALEYNFFILAPEKCFNLQKMKLVRYDPDPAIFYKIDHTHYRLIHQWGSEFSFMQRLRGMWWQSETSRIGMILKSVVFLAVTWFIAAGIELTWATFGLTLLLSVIAFCAFGAMLVGFSEDTHTKRMRWHDNKWQTDYKVVD